MMRHALAAAAVTVVIGSTPAYADTICEWMDFAAKVDSAGAPPSGSPHAGVHDRVLTQTALAMFEALNAIDRRYESYLGLPAGDSKASQDVAAATAAYHVLLAHFPGQKSALEESYGLTLEAEPNAAARESAKGIGKAAAELALKAGLVDPAIPQVPYLPRAQAGVWVPTQLPVFAPYYLARKPWIIGRVDAVRPGPPPPLTSERYARDLNEVKRLGSKTSTERTAHQTLMARYRITPDMMPSLRGIADQKGRRLVDNARLFALFNMINDDSLLAIADAKLHYNYWRPITSIRNAEFDGNPATAAEPGWEPLITTPNHPEYPCGHCIGAAATAEFMKTEYGNSPPSGVRVASRSLANAAVQVLPSWDKWAEEVSFSRTLGGVHYRFSNEAAEEMGRKIARMAATTTMRPLAK